MLIGLAYLAIPAVLVTFVWRRRRVPFRWMFLMFGAFIVSCGMTHFMEVVTLEYPLYRLSGLVKVLTALASWATVLGLVPLLPRMSHTTPVTPEYAFSSVSIDVIASAIHWW